MWTSRMDFEQGASQKLSTEWNIGLEANQNGNKGKHAMRLAAESIVPSENYFPPDTGS